MAVSNSCKGKAARATESGWAFNSAATAGGIHTSWNCDLRRSRRPIKARLEIGEVLLTASISQVLGQVVRSVVTGYVAVADQPGKSVAGGVRKFRSLTERKNALRIESNRQLGKKP